jgi:hypothetical protein
MAGNDPKDTATQATEGGRARPGGIGQAAAWMLVLSLLLFWLPVLGLFIAGVVGGRKAGSLGRGVLAALLPAIVVGGLSFLLATGLTGMPVLGFIAGLGAGALVVASVVPLLLGAALGGALS